MPITFMRRPTIQLLLLSGGESMDNNTIDLMKVAGPCRIIHGTMVANSALGSALSFDLLNGGTTGTGTTVIQASSNNLNGDEEFEGINVEIADAVVLRLLADNYTASIIVRWAFEIEMFGRV